MPDSETESKHFFRIFGTFSKKVFRLQLFVSIVGLAEAVPAGSNGQLDLATPERRLTPVTWGRAVPERPFLMVGGGMARRGRRRVNGSDFRGLGSMD